MTHAAQGFTLIELLLSIAVMTILIGLSLPVYETFTRRNDIDLTTQTIAETIRRAETEARGVDEDSVWGVNFTATTATLFKGTTYASRDTNFDEVVTLPSSVTQSGLGEMTFAKMTGFPSTTGTLTLTSTTNTTRQVTVNAKGTVDY